MYSDADISHSAILVSPHRVEWRARMNYSKIPYTDFGNVSTVMKLLDIKCLFVNSKKKQYITCQVVGLLTD